jgi:hypothetical protein
LLSIHESVAGGYNFSPGSAVIDLAVVRITQQEQIAERVTHVGWHHLRRYVPSRVRLHPIDVSDLYVLSVDTWLRRGWLGD